MNKQLLPCPFCGGEITFQPRSEDSNQWYPAFECGGDECGIIFEYPRDDDSCNEDALEFWAKNNPSKKEKTPSKSKGTYEEVAEFCKSIGLPETDAEYFFNKCEGCGWLNGNKKIKDWRATIRSWKAAGYMPSCKKGFIPYENENNPIAPWKKIKAIEELLETHPANPSFRSYRADKVTPEQKEHYENQKANLKRLKGELI